METRPFRHKSLVVTFATRALPCTAKVVIGNKFGELKVAKARLAWVLP